MIHEKYIFKEKPRRPRIQHLSDKCTYAHIGLQSRSKSVSLKEEPMPAKIQCSFGSVGNKGVEEWK
jgi:hypothetical protein